VQEAAMKTWRQDGLEFKDALLENEEIKRLIDKKAMDKIFKIDYYLRFIDRIFRKVGL
jgi:adenylosuccinate lyase